MGRKRSRTSASPPEVAGIKARLRTLLRERWHDSPTGMADELGLPQPTVWKAVAGEQRPSVQLLTALATRAGVNVMWLITGRGPRSLEGEAAVLAGTAVPCPVVPVACSPLPGPPADWAGLLDAASTCPARAAFTPTAYWLRVRAGEPISRHRCRQAAPGDWLLLETERARFPSEEQMEGRLVVVPGGVAAADTPVLAVVDEADGPRLMVDPFTLGGEDPALGEEIVVRELPGGELQAFRRPRPGRPARRAAQRRADEYNRLPVDYGEVLAVCVLLVRKQ